MVTYKRKQVVIDELSKLKKELENIEKDEQLLQTLPFEYRVAELLHSIHCIHNHTDGCSWFYESWEKYALGNQGYARKTYVELAKKYLATLGKAMSEYLHVECDEILTEDLFKFIQAIQTRCY